MTCTQNKVVQECMLLRQQTFFIHTQYRWASMDAHFFHNNHKRKLKHSTIEKRTIINKVLLF